MAELPLSTSDSAPAAKAAGERLTAVNALLYASITDAQGIIKALDTKLSVALVIFTISLPKFDAIYKEGAVAVDACPGASWPLVGLFVLSWFFGLFCAFRGLVAIDNPSDHIEYGDAKGMFYGGGHFKSTWLNIFYNRVSDTRPKLLDHLDDLPIDAAGVQKELAFEQLKLAYIRSVKIRRVVAAYTAVIVWIMSGAALWTVALALGPVKN